MTDPSPPSLDIPLLERLRAAGGSYLDPTTLGPNADAALDALAAFGFVFDRDPHRGVAYRGPAPRLCPDQIEWELHTRRVGRRVAVWRRVASTNDVAARAAQSTANDGLVVLAEEQTAGRGRRGRSWVAPPSSALLMSVLIFPPPTLDDPAWLTAWGAVAAAEVVEAWTGRPALIKWPNDVRVGGQKIAGVLVERGAGAVVGIGLNASADDDDFPPELRDAATSLARLRPDLRPLDRSELARSLIRRLDALLSEGLDRGPSALTPSWRDRLELLGGPVRVETAAGQRFGRLEDAHLGDGLRLKTDDGRPLDVPLAEILSLCPAAP